MRSSTQKKNNKYSRLNESFGRISDENRDEITKLFLDFVDLLPDDEREMFHNIMAKSQEVSDSVAMNLNTINLTSAYEGEYRLEFNYIDNSILYFVFRSTRNIFTEDVINQVNFQMFNFKQENRRDETLASNNYRSIVDAMSLNTDIIGIIMKLALSKAKDMGVKRIDHTRFSNN